MLIKHDDTNPELLCTQPLVFAFFSRPMTIAVPSGYEALALWAFMLFLVHAVIGFPALRS